MIDVNKKLNDLVDKVTEHFEIDIKQNSRERNLVMARGAFFWLARNTTKISLSKIGAAVGRDHASVLHTLKNIDYWLKYDDIFNSQFESLKTIVLNEFKRPQLTAETMLYKYNSMIIENDILKKEIKKLKKCI